MFLTLNDSGLVASFDGSVSDGSSDITNDTLLIFQDIFVGPDGKINISTASNLNGLFDSDIKDDRTGAPVIPEPDSSTEISVTQNVRQELETDPTGPLLGQEVDLENIPENELRHIIMTCIPNVESDMIEKISAILRAHGGLIELDILHDSLKNIKIPRDQQDVDERVLEAIDEINTTLYQRTQASSGPTDYTASPVNQDDGDQSRKVFGDSSSERTVTATPTTTSINNMEKPGDSIDGQTGTDSAIPRENLTGVGHVKPAATVSQAGHEQFPPTSERTNLSGQQSSNTQLVSGILPDNLEDDPHQLFSQTQDISTTQSTRMTEHSSAGDEGGERSSHTKTDQAIKLSDGLGDIIKENDVNEADTSGVPASAVIKGGSSDDGLIVTEPSVEISVPANDAQLGDVSSPATSKETEDSPQSEPTTSSSFSRKVEVRR